MTQYKPGFISCDYVEFQPSTYKGMIATASNGSTLRFKSDNYLRDIQNATDYLINLKGCTTVLKSSTIDNLIADCHMIRNDSFKQQSQMSIRDERDYPTFQAQRAASLGGAFNECGAQARSENPCAEIAVGPAMQAQMMPQHTGMLTGSGQCGMQTTKRNTEYTLTFEAPLLRTGMSLTVGPVSEKYVVEEALKALDYVRQING